MEIRFPTASCAPEVPVPYLSFGGFSATSGITRFTRIDDAYQLRSVADLTAVY